VSLDLIAERLRIAATTSVSTVPPRTLGLAGIADAYRVQQLNRVSTTGPRHYKVGATSLALRQHLGAAEPAFGVVSGCLGDHGGTLARSGFIDPRLEVEVAFVFRARPRDPRDPESIRKAVAGVRVAFEVADCRITGWDLQIVDLIADNGCAATAVLGPDLVSAAVISETARPARLWQDGEVIADGGTGQVAGGVWESLFWLCPRLAAAGLDVSEGSIVLSGTCTGASPIRDDARYRGAIEGLGSVEVRFRGEAD
jgi:2-keto-4-pentenoate hydratase